MGMEELKSQRSILVESEVDIASAERRVTGAEGLANELQYSMASLSLEGELLQAEAARRHLDDNWSLGSGRRLGDEPPGLHKHFSREAADAASSSAPSSPDSLSVAGACRLSP